MEDPERAALRLVELLPILGLVPEPYEVGELAPVLLAPLDQMLLLVIIQ